MTTTPERIWMTNSDTGPISVGQRPELRNVPATMSAQVIRRDRYGDPATSSHESRSS